MGVKFANRQHSYIFQNLKDQFLQNVTSKIQNESKLVFYKNAKDTLSLSSYLNNIKNRNSRTLLSKLRLGVLPLEIEKGRREKIKVPRENRFCKLCNSDNKIEDEIHFLFECPALQHQRDQHLNSLFDNYSFLRTFNNQQKITSISMSVRQLMLLPLVLIF